MEKTSVRYGDWLKEWLAAKEGLVKEATWANYTVAVMNHILPVLGQYQLEEITEERLQKAVLYWLKGGRIDGDGGLSKKTVKDLAVIVKSSLRAAQKQYGLPSRTMQLSYPAGGRGTHLDVLTPEDQRRLNAAVLAEPSPRSVGILLCLYTGLRIGELCALQWKDISIDSRLLTVSKTVQRIYRKDWNGGASTEVVVTRPKTENAHRDIPLASFLIPLLQSVDPQDPLSYVLTGTRTGLEPRCYRSYYDRFLARHGLPHLRFHGLRHTFATRCIEDGADYKTVSALLGHASVNLTLNLYVHPQLADKRRCVERLPTYFGE